MNTLSLERQSQILSALVEGNSVRSTSRMTRAHIGTILSLLKRVANECERLMDGMMLNLSCNRLKLEEIRLTSNADSQTLRCTPAMTARVAPGLWSKEELIESGVSPAFA